LVMTLQKPTNIKPRWQPGEMEILRLHYNSTVKNRKYIRDLILAEFGVDRSLTSIQDKASSMSITRPMFVKWTKEEEKKLEDWAGTYSTQTIADKLSRRVGSVEKKCHELKIKLHARMRHGWYTISDINSIFGVSDSTVHKWINSKKLKNEEFNGFIYKVTQKNLREFVINYPMELTGRNVDMAQLVEILCTKPSK
jgi:hypothetical protein